MRVVAKSVALSSSVALIKHIFLGIFFKKMSREKWLNFFRVTFRKTVVFKTEWKGKKGMPEYIGIIFKKCSIMFSNFCNVLRTKYNRNRKGRLIKNEIWICKNKYQ